MGQRASAPAESSSSLLSSAEYSKSKAVFAALADGGSAGGSIPECRIRDLLAFDGAASGALFHERLVSRFIPDGGVCRWADFLGAVEQILYADSAARLFLDLAVGVAEDATATNVVNADAAADAATLTDATAAAVHLAHNLYIASQGISESEAADVEGKDDAAPSSAGDQASSSSTAAATSSASSDQRNTLTLQPSANPRRTALELFPSLGKPLLLFIRARCLRQAPAQMLDVVGINPVPSFIARTGGGSVLLTPGHRFALSMASQACARSPVWQLLYRSTDHGLSFDMLCHHLVGYEGPTLLVLRSTEGHLFGGFADHAKGWLEASGHYGGTGSFLFALTPTLKVLRGRRRGGAGNYMYLHRKKGDHDVAPPGLGMGGSLHAPRLWIPEDMTSPCRVGGTGLTFANGSLCGDGSTIEHAFRIHTLEIIGCGGVEAAESLEAEQRRTATYLAKARKVDKAAFLGSEFDRQMFLGNTFAHQKQKEQGRG